MFKIDFGSTYFDTYEEARNAAIEDFDMSDFIDCGELTDYDKITDMLEELARLDSPLYYALMENALQAFCDQWIIEIEEEEED